MNSVERWFAGRGGLAAVIVVHALFLLLLFQQQGILDDKEALKYLGAARAVLQGDGDELLGRYRLYSGYILFLLPFVAVGLPKLAVLAQVMLGLLAARAVEGMVVRAGAADWGGRAAMALYLLVYPVQQWTLSLYSEGLFIPLGVLFAERAFRDRQWSPSLLLLALLVVITRPTGLLLVAPVLLLREGGRPWRWATVAALPLLMLFAPVLPRDQLEGMVQDPVVLGFPERPDAVLPPGVGTLFGLQAAVVEEVGPAHWASLVARRIASLFNPMRPWYSALHNALVAPLLLLYPLALFGLWRNRSSMSIALATAIVLNALLVGLTYDEWNGRFLAPLLPWLLVLAAVSPTARIPVPVATERA